MKFPFRVKHNGVYYGVGVEIPTSETPVTTKVEPKVTVEPKAETKVETKVAKVTKTTTRKK